MQAANEQLTLADPRVTKRKVDRELMLWNENAAIYRRRGWLMLSGEGVRFENSKIFRIRFKSNDLYSLSENSSVNREKAHVRADIQKIPRSRATSRKI